jgi:hypothetical protein
MSRLNEMKLNRPINCFTDFFLRKKERDIYFWSRVNMYQVSYEGGGLKVKMSSLVKYYENKEDEIKLRILTRYLFILNLFFFSPISSRLYMSTYISTTYITGEERRGEERVLWFFVSYFKRS